MSEAIGLADKLTVALGGRESRGRPLPRDRILTAPDGHSLSVRIHRKHAIVVSVRKVSTASLQARITEEIDGICCVDIHLGGKPIACIKEGSLWNMKKVVVKQHYLRAYPIEE